MTDIKYACRAFLKTPGFTMVIILTLALGVGATTAIFSVVNAVLLQPLPYAHADRLVVARLSLPDYRDLKSATTSFDGMAVWASNLYNLKSGTDSQQLLGGQVSPELMPLLGVEPILGRNFAAEDDTQNTVILGYGLWQTHFGGDPAVLGRTIDLSGTMYTVVGVARSGFSFPTSEFQLWTPMGIIEARAPAQARNRGLRIFSAVALLKPGVTVQQAQAEVAARSEVLARTYPATNQGVAITLQPLYERIVGDARPGLRILFVTVALLLLIACANVANLMLARTIARERELAIRAALGAAKGRLVRQVLTESVVLATAGGALGLLVAAWGVDALPTLLDGRLPRADRIQIDVSVIVFAILATLATAVCFGLVPALHAAAGPIGTLKESGRAISSGTRGRRIRHAIAIAEIALAVVVMVGAALLVRSFLSLSARDPGFVARGLTSFNVQFVSKPDGPSRAQAAERVLERVASLPGVSSVGAATGFPPVTAQRGTRFEIEGQTLTPEESGALFIAATPDFFRTLGTPVRRGRAFTRTDIAASPAVVVINETLASQLFRAADPIGKRIRLINPEHSHEWRTIVGVVGDIRYQGLDSDNTATIYTPFAQTPFLWLYYMVRGGQGQLAAIRRSVVDADPDLTAANLRAMEEVVAGTVAEPRFQTLLVASFAALALALAAIGIYGVIAYSVAQRRHEIGIRMALGAGAQTVLALVLREGLVLGGVGVALGLLGSAMLTRLMSALLVGVTPYDPLAFVAASGLLVLVAALASYVPARRAVKIDPIVALRAQ
jgi:putative ABC transport system permease protein